MTDRKCGNGHGVRGYSLLMAISRSIALRASAVLVPALILSAMPVAAQRPDVTLQRAVTAYSSAATIAIRFDQTVSNPLTNRTLTTNGELMRRRPNLLSISFSGTDQDRIVADGSNLWLYLPSSAPGQVIKVPAAAGESGMLVDPMGQILSAPISSYTITDAGTATVNGQATHAITLVPKSRSALFTKATLWIDDSDGLVRQLESAEPSGLVRKITITQFKTNVTIPRSTFEFVPPPNVRVIDGAGMVSD